MKRISVFLMSVMAIGLLMMSSSCGGDDDAPFTCPDEQVTYDNTIKAIIDKTCAYSGCHDDQPGDAPHDFTKYEGMLIVLENGRLENRAITNRNMPNPDIVPDGNPTMLTDEEIGLLQCWIDAEYPEN